MRLGRFLYFLNLLFQLAQRFVLVGKETLVLFLLGRRLSELFVSCALYLLQLGVKRVLLFFDLFFGLRKLLSH